MQMPFGYEWIFIIVIIVVLFFGVKKIPELAKSFGKATAEFEKAKIASTSLRERSIPMSLISDCNASATLFC